MVSLLRICLFVCFNGLDINSLSFILGKCGYYCWDKSFPFTIGKEKSVDCAYL